MATSYAEILKRRRAEGGYDAIFARRTAPSAADYARAVGKEFFRSTRIAEPGVVQTLGGGRVPAPIARFIDLPLNILNAPFAGVGYAAKGLSELGAAGIERLGALMRIPGARAGAVPQETPASRAVGTIAEAASGILVPITRGRQLAREAALRPQGTMRAVLPEAPAPAPVRGAAPPGVVASALPGPRIRPRPAGITAAPETIVQPTIAGPLHQRVGTAAEDLFTKAGVQRDPKLRISDQVTDLLGEGRISLGDMDATLARHNLTFTDFATGVFRPSVREAGRTLQVWSGVSQRIRALARQSGSEGEIERLKDFAQQVDGVTRLRPWWQRLGNVWRASLVTQLATAVRNFTTQVGRIGLDTLQQGMDRALQAYTRMPLTDHPVEGLGALLNIARGGRKGQVEGILKQFPREHERLFAIYSSDVATAARKESVALRAVDRVFDAAETAVNWANIANRGQEWVVRRSVFQARLAQRLASRGQSLEQMVRTNRLEAINPTDIKDAVDKALEITFAVSPPRGSPGDYLIRAVNAFGPLTQVILPFPRFLVNSMKFFYDFSPLGVLQLVSPAQRAALAAGNMKTISRTLIGTGMLGAASEIRHSEYAGERWYEVRVPDGRTIDMRPFNPFAAYLFVADVAKRTQDGTLFDLGVKDILTATLSANIRAGTGLYIVDQAIDGLLALGDPQKAVRALQTLGGEFVAGFLTPLRTITDALAQFDKFPREVRETRTEPFVGPIKARLPGLAETLPEAESPTRAGPIVREAPLLRQVTGLPLSQAKNPAERELDRLQFTRREILGPSTGDPKADRLLAKHLGPLVERRISALVQHPRYQGLTTAQKSEVLTEALRPLRAQARLMAVREDPRRFAQLRIRRRPTRERAVLEEMGIPTR